MLRDLAKRWIYSTGLLGLYHRIRNADSLTVVMFHRVIATDDPRWWVCDPDYTLPQSAFAYSLSFFRKHYNIVSYDDVLKASKGRRRLPARALLITFDDGWADNVDFALPELRRAGLPAHMFVVSDVVGRKQPFFQEQIVSAFRRGVLSVAELAEVYSRHGMEDVGGHDESLDSLRILIGALERMEPTQRGLVLEYFESVLDDGITHMVDKDGLERLLQGGVSLGLHGKTHTWMTRVENLGEELEGAREALNQHFRDAPLAADSMSFPYGAHTPEIAERTREAGYRVAMTSVPALNRKAERPSWLLARIGFETETVVDRSGRYRPDLLALYLFRREIVRLA